MKLFYRSSSRITAFADILARRTAGRIRLSVWLAGAVVLLPAALCHATPLAAQAAPAGPAQTAPAQAGSPAPFLPRLDPSITTQTLIVPGCTLRVTVEGEPTLCGDYEVDADGAIHFQLSDDENRHREGWRVAVGKRTADEARDLVTASLKKYLRVPVVHLAIVQTPRLHIEMAGSGCKSGPLLMPLSARLSDVLAACKPNADMEHILILRRPPAPDAPGDNSSDPRSASSGAATPKPEPINADPARFRTLSINFVAFQQGESPDDPALQDGDRVFVQARPEGQITVALRTVRVVGEVGRETDLPLTPDMTLKDALARAGGVKDTADTNKIRLHRVETGHDFELRLPAIQDNDPTANIKLMAGDYIMVGKTDLRMRWGIDGEVASHGVMPFNPAERLTVSGAIARAGGLTRSADRRRSVLRKGYLIDPTHARDIVFDYDAIQKKDQKDWPLEPGDVVFVLARRKRPTIWQQLLPIALRFLPLPL